MSSQIVEIKRFLTRKCAMQGIPVSGTFELTPRCNLRCKMCYIRLTPEQMASIGTERSAKEWIDFAKKCVDAGMAFLLLTGGEPTLRKDFCEIYSQLATMGISISINTNGTIITDEIKALWDKYPPAQVNVTLYGSCREDYENLCGNPDAFDAVVDALEWLQSHSILVHLNTTITPENYMHLEEIEQFAKNRGLELRVTSYCFPPTRREGCDSCKSFARLDPELAGELIVKDLLIREGKEAVKFRAANLANPVQKSCDLDNGEPMACLAGKSQFWVTWDGRMTPCGMMDMPAFYPFKDDFDTAWQGLKSACDNIRLCPECVGCEEAKSCMNCAAVTYAETGRFDGKPEYMCKLNRAYRNAVTKAAKD